MFADGSFLRPRRAVAAKIAQMKNKRKWMHRSLKMCFVLLLITTAARSQTTPDFSGLWEQDNDRCQPKRTGEVTLHIEHHGAELVVETSIAHVSARSRHAVQKYVINGKVSVSTGGDGDEFHTKVIVEAQAWSSPSRSMRTATFSIGRRRGLSSRRMQRSRGSANARAEKSRFYFIDAGNPR